MMRAKCRRLPWLLGLLLMAWLGGLVLNVMPCVLPVLSIKLMHLSEAATVTRREARLQLLLTALGILSFFWLLALVLAALKSAGYYVGWGIQFQNPYFLLSMLLLLMLLFSANLLGWFEFGLPGRWQTALAHAGDGRRHSPRIASFMQGDWSLPDGTIEAFLQRHGRSGIPFNVAYGPAQPQGLLLPELLSVENVSEAVRRAAGTARDRAGAEVISMERRESLTPRVDEEAER
jgi:thiol:disulfide interchange protein